MGSVIAVILSLAPDRICLGAEVSGKRCLSARVFRVPYDMRAKPHEWVCGAGAGAYSAHAWFSTPLEECEMLTLRDCVYRQAVADALGVP